MSDTTAELALSLAVDDDDTADYLTIALRQSLNALDGTYNQATGHNHSGSHQGGIIGPNALADNTIPATKLVDGSITTAKIGDAQVTLAKLAANMLESLYASSLTIQSANYTVVAASTVLYVWCSAAITVTLTAGINRPITVRANSGNSTVTSTAGSVIGGSVDLVSGTVINGRVNAGDALTYKWDGSNWAAV